jgi:hypothetical protein
MGIHRVTSEFMNHGKELLRRLRTPEANMLTDTEIRMLRLQFHLLDIEVSNRQHTIRRSHKAKPSQSTLNGVKQTAPRLPHNLGSSDAPICVAPDSRGSFMDSRTEGEGQYLGESSQHEA